MPDLAHLPGAELVEEGLRDLAAGQETVAALLVAVATGKLRRLGIPVPPHDHVEAELRLYDLLCREDPAVAYGRYNALLRRLVSFTQALELEEGRRLRARRPPTG